jgi:uncharacterized protein (TIGR03089 family)
VTEKLLLPLLADDPSKPLITYYDDVAGSRIELSRATAANWAAKTANWLCDEVDVEAGDGALVRLPAHWQTLGVLLGAWWCGMHVTGDPDDAEIAFVAPDGKETAPTTAVVALDAMGMGLAEEPGDGKVDYLTDIRLHGDHFSPLLPIPEDTPALHGRTVADVVAEAKARAERLGDGPRVLSTLDWETPEDLLDGVLAVLAAGGSLVQCHGTERDRLAKHAEAERVTVELPGQA